VPLQLFSMIGMAVSTLSALLVIYLFVRRIILGPEAEGVFTLFGVVFFFIGLALFGIGLLGEYVGRIYAQVRERPRYIIEGVLEAEATEENSRDEPSPSSYAGVARADQAFPR
jgi:undecaprenyl-phosphate 4-deoxy-4-formamido-L-arabinose transferase